MLSESANIPDRVRAHTADDVNRTIDREAAQRVTKDARRNDAQLEARLDELRREWDIERTLETNASLIALAGTVLGATHSKRWLIVSGTVLSFLFLHAVQGWCPPLPIFRRLGIRTREEIEREIYALRAARGDFDELDSSDRSERGRAAWEATATWHGANRRSASRLSGDGQDCGA